MGISDILAIIEKLYLIISKFRKNTISPTEILEIRQKWKTEFNDFLYKYNKIAQGSSDIIVRDITRMDEYPDINDIIFKNNEKLNIVKKIKKYIKDRQLSPWFKAELKGTYHRGVELFIYI